MRRRRPAGAAALAARRAGMMAAMTGTRAASDDLAALADHAVAAFVAHLRDERGLSPHTVAAYQRDVTQFLSFAGRAGVTDPAAVEPLLLRRFLALQRTRGLAASSIARKGVALRTLFRFLARRGLVAEDPAAGLGVPRGPRKLPVVLKAGQVDRLLAGPRPVDPIGLRDRAILELLYATGIRVGELCGLRLGAVDRQGRQGAGGAVRGAGKGGAAGLPDRRPLGDAAGAPGSRRPGRAVLQPAA